MTWLQWLVWQIERRVNNVAFGGRFFESGDDWLAVVALFAVVALAKCW